MKLAYTKMNRARQAYGWRFLAPALLFLLAVVLIPLISSLFLSFSKWDYLDPAGQPVLSGLSNFREVFTDPANLNSLKVTFLYVLVSVAAETVLGLIIALPLGNKFKGRGIFRTAVILPMMISEVVVALMWRFMLQTDNGIVNHLLKLVGLQPQVWLDKNHAVISILMAEVWQHTPFAILIFMAALSSVPTDYMEAAYVDGANYLKRLFKIILPVIKPQILVVIIFRTMFTIRVFTQPWVLTGGGPADSTLVIGVNIYRKAFRYHDMGEANALSWVLIFITVIIISLYMAFMKKGETE